MTEGSDEYKVFMVGHSHVDVVWIWPLKETIEIIMDLFKNMIKLMEKYNYFTFAQSTALYYKWVEERDPGLFEKIKKYVREGRWEVVGGSWVECDCIMPSGESLVRQFLYGKRYFREKLGVDVEVAWFPDSFGFPSTLPMILRGCGIKYFITQKLNWNDTILYPYNIFWWESPDGSRVLAYQTVGKYCDDPRNIERIKSYLYFLELRQGIKELLLIYGIGDHGGGPTEDMVREANKIESMGIKVIHTRSVDYMRSVEGKYGDKLPTHKDELYLQFHRGIYTSQAVIKELVKSAEYYIEVLEKLLVLRYLLKGESYDRNMIRELWHNILTSQFHDILSGTVSKTPYNEFKDILSKLNSRLKEMLMNVIRSIVGEGDVEALIVFNPNPRDRIEIIELDHVGVVEVHAPALSLSIIPVNELTPPKDDDLMVRDDGGSIIVENACVKLSIDKSSGIIRSIYSKSLRREILSSRGLRLEIYDDTPILGRITIGTPDKFIDIAFDCWEIYSFQHIDGVKYRILDKPESINVSRERGRITVTISYKYSDPGGGYATIRHSISLYPGRPWIEGVVDIDWHCIHRMLKLVMDTAFWAEYIVAGQPFGHVVRRNPASPYSTLYDRAKWEAGFNEWVDYSDGGIGAAIICGTRFGYDVMGRTLRLTLLRSPRFPPEARWGIPWTRDLLESQEPAEKGRYKIKYYLYIHEGDWIRGRVPTIADDLLKPVYTCRARVPKELLGKVYRVISVEPDYVSIPAIKLCEDDDSIIVRVVNPYDSDIRVRIAVPGRSVEDAELTNLIEDPIKAIGGGESVEVDVGRYGVGTIKARVRMT